MVTPYLANAFSLISSIHQPTIILGVLFEFLNLTKIEFFLANGIPQLLQYDSNKHTKVHLFKFYFIYKVKRKTIDKPYKKSPLLIQDYNDIIKTASLTHVPPIE